MGSHPPLNICSSSVTRSVCPRKLPEKLNRFGLLMPSPSPRLMIRSYWATFGITPYLPPPIG